MKTQDYKGLTDAEVLESRAKNGANLLTPPEKEPLWKKFIEKFSDPLIIILLVAGALSIGISCYEYFVLEEDGLRVFFEPMGIFIAILLATGLSFLFELKADKEFALLNQVNDDEPVQVFRNGHPQSITRKEVVVGDIVVLNTGEEVAADGELLESTQLKVDESTLTGEPICNKTTLTEAFDSNATFPSNHVLKGTKVMEGHGVMKVFAVGDHTENGKVFEAAQIDDSTKTPLNEQLERLGDLITKASYLIAALIIIGKLLVYFKFAAPSFLIIIPTAVFFYLLLKKFDDWDSKRIVCCIVLFFATFIGLTIGINLLVGTSRELSHLMAYTLNSLMIAVTLIVVAVPEGLPMAVTLSLAYSMRRMLQTNNLVRKMHACETMGATTVICTDKTGTLTQNKMQVFATNFATNIKEEQIAEGIAVNSTATLDDKGNVLGNPTEGALVLWLHKKGVDFTQLRQSTEVLQEVPFSTERKYMGTLVKSNVTQGKEILYVKGAPEIVMAMCEMNAEQRKEMQDNLLGYQRKAMRTLAFAYKETSQGEDVIEDNKVCTNSLSFMGIVAISDPVRSEVPTAVKECMAAGIDVKIVTGDTPETAKEIGRQVNLWNDATDGDVNITTGQSIAEMSDDELKEKAQALKIICRARPLDKQRLVKALQSKNEVVAVTGDGTNDAPALKAAHVGLSMGDGTSVAKEASDITIVDNSFSSISRAVMWGRSLYQNIQRFILFQMTVNVAACLIVLIGAFVGTQSPLTVTQMLWVNLIMDTFAAMALASLPPSHSVMSDKPRNRNAFIIDQPMAIRIIGVGGFFFAILTLLLFAFNHYEVNTLADILNPSALSTDGGLSEHELSLFFTIFVFLQFWNMFNARAFMTGKSGFALKGCSGFAFIALLIVIGQILIVSFGGEMFNVSPLSFINWITIIGSTSLIAIIPELFRLVKGK